MASLMLTLDAFALPFVYSPGQWTVPDTSAVSYVGTTYHSTTFPNASVALNFTGTGIDLYGVAGPAMGSYEVDLDGQTTAPVSAFAQTNSTNYRLYSSGPLTNGAHTIVLRNRGAVGSSGAELLLDYAQLTTVDKVASVKPSNVTVEDNDHVRLNYVGSWDSNNDTRFSGNTSTYTNGQGASVSLSFVGTAVYLYGDTVFDHGLFSVALDGGAPTTHNASTTFLEIGVLKYFETGLANVSHSLVVTNLGQGTYFDLDSIVYTVPRMAVSVSSSSSTGPTSAISSGAAAVPTGAVAVPKAASGGARLALGWLAVLVLSSLV